MAKHGQTISVDDLDKYEKVIIGGLRYVVKYWHRFDKYTKDIPKSWKHGPFDIINSYGYQPQEAESILALLDVTTNLLAKRGFEELLYGDVAMTTMSHLSGSDRQSGVTVGQYRPLDDVVELAVDYDPDRQGVFTLLHEFGHRFWNKFMNKEDRVHYAESLGYFSQEDIFALWKLFEAAEFDIRKAVKQLDDPELIKELRIRWKKAGRSAARSLGVTVREMLEWLWDDDYNSKYLLRDKFMSKGGDFYSEYLKPSFPSRFKSISHYGTTDPEEDFCELLAHYCMGTLPKGELMDRFLLAVGSVQK